MKFINGITNYSDWRDMSKDNARTIARKAIIRAMAAKHILTLGQELQLVQAVNVSALTGKLDGYYSISTSVLMNDRCQARAKNPRSICADCYAASNVARYSNLTQALECNYEILNGFLISDTAWNVLCIPTTNGDARIESHGDVATVTCARNYIRIIRTHKHLNFGVWTKNVDLWEKAFEIEGKPENMEFIVSSYLTNVQMELTPSAAQYVDHIFTVYDAERAQAHNITINCGARCCATCRRCYQKDTEYYINEIKK